MHERGRSAASPFSFRCVAQLRKAKNRLKCQCKLKISMEV